MQVNKEGGADYVQTVLFTDTEVIFIDGLYTKGTRAHMHRELVIMSCIYT